MVVQITPKGAKLDEMFGRRECATLPDGADELRSDIESLQLDDRFDGQMAISDALKARDEIGGSAL
jgi:hypothetical protein